MQKPRDSLTAVFDDHDMCDDPDSELHLDFPVLPPQQSSFDDPGNLRTIKVKWYEDFFEKVFAEA
jgi:hypothetical protein